MTAVVTYASLLESMLLYAERPDDTTLEAQLPTFITLAESRIAADLKLLGTQQVVVGAFTQGNPVLEKPSYWRDNISVNYTNAAGERTALKLRTYEFCRAFWPTEANEGAPRFYADYDYGHLLVVPTPDAAYELELLYHARLAPLDASNQENWISFNTPQLILYACMLELHLWLKNDEKVDVWGGQYNAARDALLGEGAARRVDRGVLVTSS